MPHVEPASLGADPSQPSPVGHETHHHDNSRLINPGMVILALGVVFGDIGTSPIYTLRTCFSPILGLEPNPANIFGVLSMIFWTLMIIVSIKYATFLMRADNRGEGGILALMVLALKNAKLGGGKMRPILIGAAVLGTALFFGDGILSPAISVLSAVEGLEVLIPGSGGAEDSPIAPFVVPIALTILTGLFLVQRHGTRIIGLIGGPIMLIWFLTLGALGVWHIVDAPQVLQALDFNHAVTMFRTHPGLGLAIFGAVVLCVTGAEALYADMGHFGRRSIRQAWFFVAFPCLILNYFGQGALMIEHPETAKNPFYLMVDGSLLIPLIVLTTLATIIASQAVISGAFSVYRQGIQLGFLPRARIVHTSASEIGQVYVPVLNGMLMIGVIVLVLSFRSSEDLVHAYGLAVTGTMLMNTFLAWFLFRQSWRWPVWIALPMVILFGIVDLTYFSANMLKLNEGGWLPLMMGLVVFFMVMTWISGRAALVKRRRDGALSVEDFLAGIRGERPRVPGTAIYLTVDPGAIPPALLHNMKHNHVLHERIILLTVRTEDVPRVRVAERLQIQAHEKRFWTVIVHYGYMEKQDLPKALAYATAFGLDFDPMTTSFFISREHLVPSAKPPMRPWRLRMFIWLTDNAQSAADFFRIPPNRVVELGGQIEL